MPKTPSAVGLACAGALALSFAGTATAEDQKASARSAPQRVVMQCDRDDATRRAFTRQHGSAPVFVTAREVRVAISRDEAWAAPRCMTAREHARLTQSMADMASAH